MATCIVFTLFTCPLKHLSICQRINGCDVLRTHWAEVTKKFGRGSLLSSTWRTSGEGPAIYVISYLKTHFLFERYLHPLSSPLCACILNGCLLMKLSGILIKEFQKGLVFCITHILRQIKYHIYETHSKEKCEHLQRRQRHNSRGRRGRRR